MSERERERKRGGPERVGTTHIVFFLNEGSQTILPTFCRVGEDMCPTSEDIVRLPP